MSKIRTQQEALNDIKQVDPKSSLTLYAIRTLVNNGTISHIRRGNKILIDLEELQDYLNFRKIPAQVTGANCIDRTESNTKIKPSKSRF